MELVIDMKLLPPQEEVFMEVHGVGGATSQGGILFNLSNDGAGRWSTSTAPNGDEKNILLRANKVRLEEQFPPGRAPQTALFPEIVIDSSGSIFGVQIGSKRDVSNNIGIDSSGNEAGAAGSLTISQSAYGAIGNSHNDYLSGRPNAPADSKFGKMRDNLRLESRTIIPLNQDTQGPKVGISFNAENFRPAAGRLNQRLLISQTRGYNLRKWPVGNRIYWWC